MLYLKICHRIYKNVYALSENVHLMSERDHLMSLDVQLLLKISISEYVLSVSQNFSYDV